MYYAMYYIYIYIFITNIAAISFDTNGCCVLFSNGFSPWLAEREDAVCSPFRRRGYACRGSQTVRRPKQQTWKQCPENFVDKDTEDLPNKRPFDHLTRWIGGSIPFAPFYTIMTVVCLNIWVRWEWPHFRRRPHRVWGSCWRSSDPGRAAAFRPDRFHLAEGAGFSLKCVWYVTVTWSLPGWDEDVFPECIRLAMNKKGGRWALLAHSDARGWAKYGKMGCRLLTWLDRKSL